ncbi:MAG: isoaspartyl peptidase/L-asparaginase [Phycisphaerae bacterium]|nr:isoaspartyl peptidase/L-asparaginase [Phycisphaerae bacterium]
MAHARPQILSTWSFGRTANAAGWPILRSGGAALDAVVAAATAVEDDPAVDSVGLGGLPDASGRVSLDASVMTDPDRCGSVCYLRGYRHAAALARAVIEKTTHVMLAGDGAEAFAARQGHRRVSPEALSPAASAAFAQWRSRRAAAPPPAREGELPPMNVEERYRNARNEPSHDTVCVLARDAAGSLAGAVTTSGLAFKVPGRVGDSPIIGAGLYVDQRAGAAAATGNGELVMGVCGSFLVVERMRLGLSPGDAIAYVLDRIRDRYRIASEHQVAFIAMSPDGRWAQGALAEGFTTAYTDSD